MNGTLYFAEVQEFPAHAGMNRDSDWPDWPAL